MSGERTGWRERYGRRRAEAFKTDFPVPEFLSSSQITIKNIAYLFVYCRLEPDLIVARNPKCLTLGDVFLALAHYFRNPEPIDAEIRGELAFNGRDGLASSSMTLPRVAGLPDSP
jgi:hypothetical protein